MITVVVDADVPTTWDQLMKFQSTGTRSREISKFWNPQQANTGFEFPSHKKKRVVQVVGQKGAETKDMAVLSFS